MRKLESHDWWPEMVALKDDLSLRELGEKFGVTPGAIMNAFRRNDIERKPAPPGPRKHRKNRKKSAKADNNLPPEPGEGADGRKGSKDVQIEEVAHLLGTVPDREVAEAAGVSLRTVAAYRARKGIAGYSGPRKAPSRGRKSKIDPFADEVGRVPDRIIADKAGVSVNAVRNWRRVRGISAFNRTAAPAQSANAPIASSPTPVAAVRSNGASSAWRVSLADGSHGVVLGSSISDAARRAEAAGAVTGIELVGALL